MSSIRWKRFFVDSGLPSEACENYAVIFSENRIGFDMLDELNKEILYDMGIKKMGDVISILRHAKEVHSSSYREKLFAKDEGNESRPQPTTGPTTSKLTKADSTIKNDNNVSKSVTVDRRIIIPQRAINAVNAVINSNKSAQEKPAQRIRKVAPVREPVIIRNVTGLSAIVSNANKRRVEAPGDEFTMQRTKIAKTEFSNPLIRNRVEAQSRLSNQKKDITKILTSNAPRTLTRVTTSPEKAKSVKSRLTLNQPDSTTITINRTPPIRVLPNNNIQKSVKSRLGPAIGTGVKDRLGSKSSVFERRVISTSSNNHKSNSSVFNRLGV